MAGKRLGVKIRYRPTRTYRTFQSNYVGAQTEAGKRGWWPQTPSVLGGITPAVTQMLKWGGLLFIVGDFDTIDGEFRPSFAAIDIATGELVTDRWAFHPNGSVAQSLATDGTYLYVGGDFNEVSDEQGHNNVTEIDGSPIAGLVRLDQNGDLDTTWNPAPNANPDIEVLVYNPDRASLYVSGNGLTSIGGQSRTRVAEVLVSDGTATSWNPDPDQDVLAIALDTDRDLVYLGGRFDTLNAGGTTRHKLARTDYDGTVDAWDPDSNDEVFTIFLDGGGAYVGGFFTQIGVTTVSRAGGAFLDDQGEAREWDPGVDISIKKIARYREFIFIGGNFTTCDSAARNGLALLHDADHWLGGNQDHDDWDPQLSDADVKDFLLLDRTLYVGGSFTSSAVSANQKLQAISWPIFTDANSIYFSKDGDDADPGTAAAPKLTPEAAVAARDDDHRYAVCQDGGTYDLTGKLSMAHAQTWELPGGLFAADGFAPTFQIVRGPVTGTYGARRSGRTKFSTGAGSTFLYVAKNGADGTGTRGDPSLPFKTHAAAIAAALTGDTIQTQDSGTYIEDLVIGNLNLIFQAADGQVPTLQNGAGSTHISVGGTGTLEIYGYYIADLPKVTGQVFNVSRSLTVWDCTISGNNYGIQTASGNAITISVNGTILSRTNGPAIRVVNPTAIVTLVVDNSAFKDCNPTSLGDITYSLSTSTVSCPATVTRTGFYNSRGTACIYFQRLLGPASGGGLTVSRCLFQNDTPTPSSTHGILWQFIQNAGGIGVTVSDSSFIRLGRRALVDTRNGIITNTAGVVVACPVSIKRVFSSGCSTDPTGTVFLGSDWPGAIVLLNPRGATVFEDVVVITDGTNGIIVFSQRRTGTVTLTRCALIKSRYYFEATPECPITLVSCYQAGPGPNAGLRLSPNGTPSECRISYSIFDLGITGSPTRGAYVRTDDPEVLSTFDGAENIGLLPTGPAFDSYLNQTNIGPAAPLLEVTATVARFFIDGFVLTGDANLYDGIATAYSMAAPVEVSFDTFDGLGPQGLLLASGSDSRNCYYATNGIAINAADSGGVVTRNVGAVCEGTFLAVAGTGTEISNNTAYGCQYGQFDMFGASPAFAKNQVLSASTVLDYAGPNTQTFSDVERKSDDATVSSTRLNPLFRNLVDVDLRLQATDNGDFFDSPAIGIADDGGDAGAYGFEYSPPDTEWELIEMLQGGYVNPYWMPRQVVVAKLAEDITHGGVTFSDGSATVMEFVFEWPETAWMPEAQIADMQALFESTAFGGECQLSFDGGTTWMPAIRLLSGGFEYQELRPLTFAYDGAGMRLARAVFRIQPS